MGSTPTISTLNQSALKHIFINNQIRAREVRVIDEAEKQLGVMDLVSALQLARERGLDLIQVTERVEPPVCKIMDAGKYFYRQRKREKTTRPRGGAKPKNS